MDAIRPAYGGLFRYQDERSLPRGTTKDEYEGPTDDCSEHAPLHADGGYSTTDSDAEVDALVAQTYAREQYHRLSDHQQELLEHAMRESE